MTTNGTSMSSPLQNACNPCSASQAKQVMQFSSASEVAEYKRRLIFSTYYNNSNNPFPIKNRYSSMMATYKGAVGQKLPVSVKTCCSGNLSQKRSNALTNKTEPFFTHNSKHTPT
jgi:hypothetical protein